MTARKRASLAVIRLHLLAIRQELGILISQLEELEGLNPGVSGEGDS